MNNDIHAAKTIALKYLSRAPRSIREVELKLKGKDIGKDAIKKTINCLLELGYLNDEVFAKQRADSKIKSRLWGRNRVIHDLKQKGISEEIIKRISNNEDASEFNTAEIAIKKWIKSKGQGGKRTWGQERQKAFRHLQAKGFSTSIIISVMKEYWGELEIDESQ
ncbi:MAG: regulatory protein RecX [Deltaproteobacteria bacterium]|nr:regulatory protein RecX [Deltaproteobacteria bacterium]